MKKPYGDYSMRRAMLLIAFGVLLFVLAGNLSAVGRFLRWGLSLISPLILGLAIAFVLNVPMRAIERHLFPKGKRLQKLRRPLALILTLLAVIGVLTLAGLLVCTAYLVDGTYNPFLYFRF